MTKTRGFTVIELVVVMGVMITLLTLASVSVVGSQRKSQIQAVLNSFEADIKSQQTKAMTGATEGGSGGAEQYGVYFKTNPPDQNDSYVLFRGAVYPGTADTEFTISERVSLTTTFPGNKIVFDRRSGEIVGFQTSNNTVTLIQKDNSEQKTLYFNAYGVIVQIL